MPNLSQPSSKRDVIISLNFLHNKHIHYHILALFYRAVKCMWNGAKPHEQVETFSKFSLHCFFYLQIYRNYAKFKIQIKISILIQERKINTESFFRKYGIFFPFVYMFTVSWGVFVSLFY